MRYRKQVSANVRAQIAYHDLTGVEVAKIVGVSQPQLSKRLHGQLDWKLGELVALAQAWNKPLEELIAGINDDPFKENGTVEAVSAA